LDCFPEEQLTTFIPLLMMPLQVLTFDEAPVYEMENLPPGQLDNIFAESSITPLSDCEETDSELPITVILVPIKGIRDTRHTWLRKSSNGEKNTLHVLSLRLHPRTVEFALTALNL